MTQTLYIVVPAYNESANIEKLLNDWYPVVQQHNEDGLSRLVIVDDGSTDDTRALLEAHAADMPLLVVCSKQNGGHGAAVLYGYRYAIENNADFIFQTDSDGQTNPDEFAAFWDARNDYDAIFGNRTKRGDGEQRAFVERVVCLMVKLYFGVSVPDANAPFRLMRRDYVADLIPYMPHDYGLLNIMLTALGAYFKRPITFREITFAPRVAGNNTINFKRIFKIGMQSLKDFAAIRNNVKSKKSNA